MSATNFPAIRRLLVIAKNESGVCSATDAGYQAQEAIPEIESILALNAELLTELEIMVANCKRCDGDSEIAREGVIVACPRCSKARSIILKARN